MRSFGLEMSRPATPDAKGAMRRRGRSKRPARVGEVADMAWERCGRETTRVVNGKPVKNALLEIPH